ncbi:MAG: hypothetical protein IPL99_15475 [Candidatus Competibacteraceae bacterium]|nr:hypothetical protein [Candidatus Competibacteraceae bacterium]
MSYDFDTRRFIGASGNEFTEDLFRELANGPGARAAQAGAATLKRSVLVDSLVQGAGREGWRNILGAIALQSSPLGLDEELKRLFYSQSKDDHAIATYAIFRHDPCTLG